MRESSGFCPEELGRCLDCEKRSLIGCYRKSLFPGIDPEKTLALSSSQVNALLRQAQVSRDPIRDYAIIQVLFQTGIRLSECSALTFDDVTFGERSGVLVVHACKGNKVRSVPLNSSARDALALSVAPRLTVEKASIKVVAKSWPKPKSPESFLPVFESQKGELSQPQQWDKGHM